MPPPVFRFAPSPNGYLHLGHAFSAILNFDLARETGGRFNENGTPTAITFFGRPFGEAELLATAKAYQDATDFHRRHPKLELTKD